MLDIGLGLGLLLAALIAVSYLASSVRIVKEYERGVVFFFGRYVGLKAPGLRLVFPPMYRMIVVDLRTIVEDVAPQDIITKDNVSATVNAVIYFRVIDPDKAVLQVENYRFATARSPRPPCARSSARTRSTICSPSGRN